MRAKSYQRIIPLCGLTLTVSQAMALADTPQKASKPSAPIAIETSKITVVDVQSKSALFDLDPTSLEQTSGRANIDNFLSGKSDTLYGFDARNNRHR